MCKVVSVSILLMVFLSVCTVGDDDRYGLMTWYGVKKELDNIHGEIGHRKTVYCQCEYEERTNGSGWTVLHETCDLMPRDGSSIDQSGVLHWEHAVPASWFGNYRTCWNEGHLLCGSNERRDCCEVEGVDDEFMYIFTDLHNLFPSDGQINMNRSNYAYGEILGEDRLYGACDVEITVGGTRSERRMELSGDVRGEIARAILHMKKRYGDLVRLPESMMLIDFKRWSDEDQPERWERERARLIEERTGIRNEFILE